MKISVKYGLRRHFAALVIGCGSLGALGLGVARAEDASFKLKVDVPAAQKGVPAVAKITLQPGPGYHVNKSYPTSLALTPPPGVTVDKPKLAGADAVRLEEAGAQFDVKFTAAEAGQKTIAGELKFAVCSASSCDPKKEKLTLVVNVK